MRAPRAHDRAMDDGRHRALPFVATLVGVQGLAGPADPAAMLMPGQALLVTSSVMAWLALARH